MSVIVVLAYRTRENATAAMDELVKLQEQGALTLDDAVFVTCDERGKIQVEQSEERKIGKQTGKGALLGGVVGALFLVPVAGIAAGAALGIASAFRDQGLDDDFVKKTAKSLTPGSAALFLEVAEADRDRVIAAIKPFNANVIETSLSPEAESMLRVKLEDI
jgi:uncharacterized membrane protein